MGKLFLFRVTAIDSKDGLGPLLDANGKRCFNQHEVVINSWLAENLEIELGDWLRIDYFEPKRRTVKP